MRDGNPITDANRNVLPGEKLNLSIQCASTGGFEDVVWTVPGVIFKNYTANANAALLAPITSADLVGNVFINFYWADTGSSREVKVTFGHDGQVCILKEIFNVRAPVVALTAAQGSVGYISTPAPRFGLYPLPLQADGMLFLGSVDVPPGFPEGTWHFVQIITANTQINSSGVCVATVGGPWLDTRYPMFPAPFDPAAGSPGSWATGSGPHSADDTPQQLLLSAYTQVNRNESFATYIMFKPSGVDSRWVPLKRIVWQWAGCAAQSGGGVWSLHSPSQSMSGPFTISAHPVWSANVATQPANPAVCASPCVP